ncbi:MAG: 1-(5-phosphoribosyl)-5-[(5-phosphoribosylamino)methylideneamino]imidazole-4-carboxamide isomerase [Christensenellaceae bacterium]|nr:1-(5-phosphoribosyl)-5-[(5-phosphoribosylamino)methylideneamino]imidazole-4-carboxamide isomerase [Christensenellaceae bacterium]MEA5068277.1 1-(5-phosphoribosyl)-5-[(5-phosphoribosylamino)methylideneamino]imidazole-4-carboxamide isomerase [Christensenellaceae bacterium]
MLIFPAIDLLDGQVVRLQKGDYGRVTVYGRDPAAAARAFAEQGATHLHVVDLDGARTGTQINMPVIERIAREGGLFIEVGGGIRDEAAAARYLDTGVNRVILGTLAATEPERMARLAAQYPGQIAAGVDARDGRVAIRGWREATSVDALQFLTQLPALGVDTAIYTDIARDGMLGGANLDAYRAAAHIQGLQIVASGGVSTIADIRSLAAIGLYGAIVGRALYENALTLEGALAAAKEGNP